MRQMNMLPGWENTLVTAGAASAATAATFLAYVTAGMLPASRVFGYGLYAPRRPGEIALTFDDGPNPAATPRLLEILARHQLRATFFLIGHRAAAHPELVREIHAAGHLIGNHTWTHPNLAFCTPGRTLRELDRTSETLAAILGQPIGFFRPPFGARSPWTIPIARSLGLTTVMWNSITNDWSAPTAEPIALAHLSAIALAHLSAIARNTARGRATNLVLHDGGHREPTANRSPSVTATEEIIQGVLAANAAESPNPAARFVRLDDWL